MTIAGEALEQPVRLDYLEGCIRAYVGQATSPLLLSSGMEDYFLGTDYFDTGYYHGDTAGLSILTPRRV
ncbi:MAG: hypothetical protein RLZZ522_1331 [Verrucomicrobiota bacterium]